MPVKTVPFGVSTTSSVLSSPSSSRHRLSFLHIITLCLSPLSDFIALLTATLKSFINLGFHFLVLHLPALSVFIVSDGNELGFTLSLLHGLLLYCYSLV